MPTRKGSRVTWSAQEEKEVESSKRKCKGGLPITSGKVRCSAVQCSARWGQTAASQGQQHVAAVPD